MTTQRLVNLFNGDYAYEAWRLTGLTGEPLVWRENYLIGELPHTDDIEKFNRIRAMELHKISPEISCVDIFTNLQDMHLSLLSLTTNDSLKLYFDCCPFDNAMLKRVAYLLGTLNELPHIELIRADVVWAKDEFLKYHNCGIKLGRKELELICNIDNADKLLKLN